MKRALLFAAVLLVPAVLRADAYKTIFNPHTGRLDFVNVPSTGSMSPGATYYAQLAPPAAQTDGFNVGSSTATDLKVTGNLTVVGLLTQFGPAVTRATETVKYYILQPNGVDITTVTFSTNGFITVAFGGEERTVLFSTAGVIGGESGGVQANSTTTWTAQQIFNLGAGSLNPLLTITTGTQNLVEVTGSSFTVSMASSVFQVGKFEVISPSPTITGSLIASAFRWRGPTTTHGRLYNDGTNIILGTDDNAPSAIRSNATNIAIFSGVSPSHIELLSNVGINTTNPSSRLDLFNGSATVRGTGGSVGLSVVGGSLTIRAHAGQGLSDPIFSVSTGAVRLFNVYATSVTAGVPINASVEQADKYNDENYPILSIKALAKFIKANGHLPLMPKGETMDKGLTDLGDMIHRLLATAEISTRYIVQLDRRVTLLEWGQILGLLWLLGLTIIVVKRK